MTIFLIILIIWMWGVGAVLMHSMIAPTETSPITFIEWLAIIFWFIYLPILAVFHE